MGALDRLQKLYGVVYSKTKSGGITVSPGSEVEGKNGKTQFKKENFPNEVQRLFDMWLNNTYQSEESWKSIAEAYDDCDDIYFNSGKLARAIKLTTDEVLQIDSNDQPITIEAPSKQRKFIQALFDKIGLFGKLPAIVEESLKEDK